MKALKPWLILAAYLFMTGLAYGRECEELLPGEKPSGEIPVCSIMDFLPEGYEWDCDSDTDCYEKCKKAAHEGFVPLWWCEEAN